MGNIFLLYNQNMYLQLIHIYQFHNLQDKCNQMDTFLCIEICHISVL